MTLAQIFLRRIEGVGPVIWRKAFGWICAHRNRNLFGGYKFLDDNVIILFLILSTDGFERAMKTGHFEKFDFGKTWVETEITSEKILEEILPFVKNAFDYAAERGTTKPPIVRWTKTRSSLKKISSKP